MSAEKNASDLVKAVALAIPEYGKEAAKEMVLEMAGEDSLTSFARLLRVDRSSLSTCLSGNRPHHRLRRQIEAHLDLTPGAMTNVLAMVESL